MSSPNPVEEKHHSTINDDIRPKSPVLTHSAEPLSEKAQQPTTHYVGDAESQSYNVGSVQNGKEGEVPPPGNAGGKWSKYKISDFSFGRFYAKTKPYWHALWVAVWTALVSPPLGIFPLLK